MLFLLAEESFLLVPSVCLKPLVSLGDVNTHRAVPCITEIISSFPLCSSTVPFHVFVFACRLLRGPDGENSGEGCDL